MRRAACLLAGALCLALLPSPSPAMTPTEAPSPSLAELLPSGPSAVAETAPVLLAGCGPRCRAHRRAIRRHYRRHHWRPYRPRPNYHHHYYRERRRDAAAAAIIGGVIGLGVGAAIANQNRPHYGYDRGPEFDQFGQTR